MGKKEEITYVEASVQVVPVIAAGFTDGSAGDGDRSTTVGGGTATAVAAAAKTEMRSESCMVLDIGVLYSQK